MVPDDMGQDSMHDVDNLFSALNLVDVRMNST